MRAQGFGDASSAACGKLSPAAIACPPKRGSGLATPYPPRRGIRMCSRGSSARKPRKASLPCSAAQTPRRAMHALLHARGHEPDHARMPGRIEQAQHRGSAPRARRAQARFRVVGHLLLHAAAFGVDLARSRPACARACRRRAGIDAEAMLRGDRRVDARRERVADVRCGKRARIAPALSITPATRATLPARKRRMRRRRARGCSHRRTRSATCRRRQSSTRQVRSVPEATHRLAQAPASRDITTRPRPRAPCSGSRRRAGSDRRSHAHRAASCPGDGGR